MVSPSFGMGDLTCVIRLQRLIISCCLGGGACLRLVVSMGRSWMLWKTRGWSGGRKSYEAIGDLPWSFICCDAAWRLRMTNVSIRSGQKQVLSLSAEGLRHCLIMSWMAGQGLLRLDDSIGAL